MRVDRFLSNLPRFNRQQVRLLLVQGRVQVDGETAQDGHHPVSEFSQVTVDGETLQAGRPPRYFMLHKPMGCVSATRDPQHPTVLDLLDEPDKQRLHIAGRLDFNTSGLLLITDDGQWSRRLTQPGSKLPKVYHVETEQAIGEHYAETFGNGIYFAFEDLTTLPAQLTLLDSHSAHLTLVEGRYHQVKRMFGFFQNKVVRLHRERIGEIVLDPQLAPGQYRPLTAEEIQPIWGHDRSAENA
jgi:16S rRNA pseudouridine516 synthase